MHIPASGEDIRKFMTSHEGGPTLDDLHVDVDGGLRSDWNKRWFYLTRLDFLETMAEEIHPRTDNYWADLIKDQFNRLCVEWKKMQPKRNEDGLLETISDTERRVNEQATRAEKSKRHTSRQHNVRYRFYIIRYDTYPFPLSSYTDAGLITPDGGITMLNKRIVRHGGFSLICW